jgi:uncharacterized phage-associated protein
MEKNKTYDSVLAAKYLLALAAKKGHSLNVTKVQKLLFIAYGYFLAKYGHAFLKEKPKAWPYGPVFPRTRKKVDYSIIYRTEDQEFTEIAADLEVTQLFEHLIDTYAKYTANQLSEWSHMVGSPWDKTRQQKGFDWNAEIPDNVIENYFLQVDV